MYRNSAYIPSAATPVSSGNGNWASLRAIWSRSFGSPEAFQRAKEALAKLTAFYPKEELRAQGYSLYAQLRPNVGAGRSGWGRKGVLSVDKITSLKNASL